MKPAMQNIFGKSKQRGFRLRCFLGRNICLVQRTLVLALPFADAQITVEKPIHVTHVYGFVMSDKWKAASGRSNRAHQWSATLARNEYRC